jgi:hypothetical protein
MLYDDLNVVKDTENSASIYVYICNASQTDGTKWPEGRVRVAFNLCLEHCSMGLTLRIGVIGCCFCEFSLVSIYRIAIFIGFYL